MKSLKTCLVLAILMALAAISLSAIPSRDELSLEEDNETTYNDETSDLSPAETGRELTSLRGGSLRFLSEIKPRVPMTCDKYPRVCRAKGSTGPDCCKKKCVNVMTDRLNCGKCGKKCKYSELCCKGQCVNPRSDRKHCGSCGNKCKKGSLCVYGMCSYA
ncbi:hypothetical protein I3760_09G092800 [Carya illinoinensis]|uniref:Stigma-specific STIG1-like protein 1 n=1 Tax=Carya illinoinensis TaxID=32201 RepID=A0A8T1PKZ9_CARIL|nr:stigma-specific STIG1-like protein 1 [Carya illinoinensis]KAG2688363.1 hypothetical protein I3760_09G092800 [Carya illinoinensis]KAG6641742.1 hypothetical protein CIPAW_09G095900 [Carya illinoinensis]KAG6695335.1 hypothetical protein I3842_09G093700 [Carya illinoinensis]